METLHTKEAADRVGVDVAKFHRLVRKYKITPAFEAPGKRGAKFWLPRDLELILAKLAAAEDDAA